MYLFPLPVRKLYASSKVHKRSVVDVFYEPVHYFYSSYITAIVGWEILLKITMNGSLLVPTTL